MVMEEVTNSKEQNTNGEIWEENEWEIQRKIVQAITECSQKTNLYRKGEPSLKEIGSGYWPSSAVAAPLSIPDHIDAELDVSKEELLTSSLQNSRCSSVIWIVEYLCNRRGEATEKADEELMGTSGSLNSPAVDMRLTRYSLQNNWISWFLLHYWKTNTGELKLSTTTNNDSP
jgi:hypothetical protein